MSVDVQLAHPCPHTIIEEPVSISTDRQWLMGKSPIGSTNTVRVLVNNELYVPSAGLHSQAQLIGEFGGPFRIDSCTNTFTVVSSSETATISLPTGLIDVNTVVRFLVGALSDVAVEVVSGSRILLTDTANIGKDSFLRVSGTAASALGFRYQTGTKGKMVYPPWGIFGSDNGFGGRYVRFAQPLMSNPTIKLTYVAPVNRCMRCGGSYIENDARFDLQGDTILVSNENLLYEAALKIILTRVRSNPYHPTYGSALTSRLGMKAVGATAMLLTQDVQQSLALMQNLQNEQSKYQTVTRQERLYSVMSVRVQAHANDPTVFLVNVVVSNASGDPVEISIVFSVSGVVALAGSNGLTLGLETTGLSADESRSIFRG